MSFTWSTGPSAPFAWTTLQFAIHDQRGCKVRSFARGPQSALCVLQQPPHLYSMGSCCSILHGSRRRQRGPSRAGRADCSQHAGLVLLADAGGLQVLAQHLQVARERILKALLTWGCRGSRDCLLLQVQQGVLLLLPHRLLPNGWLPTGVSAIALHPAGAPTCVHRGSRLTHCADEQNSMDGQAKKEQQVQIASWGLPPADDAQTHATQMQSSSRAMSQLNKCDGQASCAVC